MRPNLPVVLLIIGGIVLGVGATLILQYYDDETPSAGLPPPDGEPTETLGVEVEEEEDHADSETGSASTPIDQIARFAENTPLRVDELIDSLATMVREGSRDRSAFEARLAALIFKREDPTALDAVFRFMEDPRCRFSQKAAVFFSLLADVEDPRIYPSARRVLNQNIRSGKTNWSNTSGYIALIAKKGGTEGADLVVSLLGQDSPVALVAATEIFRLRDPNLVPALLEHLETETGPKLFAIADGLAKWEDPSTTEALFRLVQSDFTKPETRASVLRALFRNLPANQLEVLTQGYWTRRTDGDRVEFLEALGYVTPSNRSEREAVQGATNPILENALSDASVDVWRSALATLEAQPEALSSVRTTRALERLMTRAELKEDIRRIQDFLQRERSRDRER